MKNNWLLLIKRNSVYLCLNLHNCIAWKKKDIGSDFFLNRLPTSQRGTSLKKNLASCLQLYLSQFGSLKIYETTLAKKREKKVFSSKYLIFGLIIVNLKENTYGMWHVCNKTDIKTSSISERTNTEKRNY